MLRRNGERFKSHEQQIYYMLRTNEYAIYKTTDGLGSTRFVKHKYKDGKWMLDWCSSEEYDTYLVSLMKD